jgi:prepilin-type N-terminal cleavage/methylation domain-containing protein
MATETTTIATMPRRTTCRRRVTGRSTHPIGACRAVRGFTLIELLVAMMLFAVMVGTALAAFPRRPYAVWTAQADVVAELRRTRNDALTRGDHFRMVVTGPSTWATYRLTLAGGVWVPNPTPVRAGTLPGGIQFMTGVGKQFEFTTRGLMLTPDAATTLVIEDIESYRSRGVAVYPSGQVAPA